MPRIRSIKPEFWSDRKLARLSRDARLLYIALWNQSDEHGRLQGDARYIKGHCFPYDDDLSLTDIGTLLNELEQHGRVVRYEHDDDPYLYLPKLAQHQRLEPHKQQSRLPTPSEPTDDQPPPSTDLSEPGAGKSAPRADNAEPIVAQQVAGSRLQVAGSRVGETPNLPPQAARSRDDPVDAIFETWWQAYPRHEAKAAARKAYAKAVRYVDPERIMAGTVRYRDDPNRTPEFTPHPATWLNAGRWDDEPLPNRPGLRAVAGNPSNPNKEW